MLSDLLLGVARRIAEQHELILAPKKGQESNIADENRVRVGNAVKLFKYKNKLGAHDYSRYRSVQQSGNVEKLDKVWVRKENIEIYSKFILDNIGQPKFGLCHGTRRGCEQSWFSEYLGCPVLGTEISETAPSFPNTIQWDFHDIKEEWLNSVDFIYSNSFDHSYDPEHCLNQWMRCIRPGGLCLIEHSDKHEPSGVSELDPFGVELPWLLLLITRWGGGRFFVKQLLEELPYDRKPEGYLCCIAINKA